jgi:hypothetical protein
MKLIKRF